MQIAFHVGVHGTEEGRILRCLEANRRALRAAQVDLSQNSLNEPILSEALNALKGGTASPAMEEVVHDALFERDDTRRLIVSRATLLGGPRRLLEGEGLLASVPARLRDIANVVPSAEVEFFLALKNPATLAPDALSRMTVPSDQLAASLIPDNLRWAPAIRRILAAIGNRRLILWCNEDLPLVFPDVVRRLAGLPPTAPLKEDGMMAEALLTEEGKVALAARTAGIAPDAVADRRAATAAVLAAHHRPEALTTRITGLAWDQATIDRMTAAYDADVAEIAALPGVEFIMP